MISETAFEMAASSIRFGVGVTREVGADLKELGARRVLLVTDPIVRDLPPVRIAMESLHENGIDAAVYERVRVEPTDASILDGIAFARERSFDAFVAVGGGSTIDTAKAVNLYTSCPADFLDYVNPPIGKGLPVPGPLKPLMAIPTTAGTGSETTGVAIFDLESLHAKTGRVLHGHAVHGPAAAGTPGSPTGVSGLEPDQRRLVPAGFTHGGAVSRSRRRGSWR